VVCDQLADGSLVKLIPDWAPRREIIHAVFSSRRGKMPAVGALLYYLAEPGTAPTTAIRRPVRGGA
jgi:DNA-binding transcriptional LysR family regulator